MMKKKNLFLKHQKLLHFLIHTAVNRNLLRNALINSIQKTMYHNLVEKNVGACPKQVQKDKMDMARALFHTINRNIKRKLFSKQWLHKFVDIHIKNLQTRAGILNEAKKRLGFKPPLFIVISPGKKCNLRCPGCYASSTAKTVDKLDWDIMDRILTEKQERWGSYLTVIAGGEPFMWEDKGKNLLDLAEKHNSQFFMTYTNGTLIDKETVRRLKKLGNFTPAISVEGFEQETDKRRGKGVYKKILEAMAHLREAGVPFGVSVTAMKHNWDLVSGDAFLDFWFDQQGASYGWIFQYMPIGDRSSFDLVVPPEERMEMLKRLWKAVRERKLFMADFWNSGTATSGCIAGGRSDGYLHITWEGDAAPCVFVPYAAANIKDIYREGGTLDDLLLVPMMKRVREWQASYGFTICASQHQECSVQNWLAPCFIRDHYEKFLEVARECTPKPLDPGAEIALESNDYHEEMFKYGRRFNTLSSLLWNSFYLADEDIKN